VPQFRDFLDRFRPAPAPGAASRVGVAADRTRELRAELNPVLALLAATQADCEHIIAAAGQDARRIADQAQRQATATAAESQRQAEAARAAAADAAVAAAQAQASELVTAAVRRAQSPRLASEEQISGLVASATGLINGLAGGNSPR
jgi:F0F1-type ATP synthase membrane subunit b/b'